MITGDAELLIQRTEWRAPIPCDISGRIEADSAVRLALQHGKTHQRLDAGDENLAGFEQVLIVYRYLPKIHVTPIFWRRPLAAFIYRHPTRIERRY